MRTWDDSLDVAVIGSGLAGLAAAIEAGDAGARVAVFEKMKITGGNTRISDGGLCAPNNFLQQRLGIEDSVELFLQDLTKAGLGLNHPELVRVLAEKGASAIDWTRRELGVVYQDRLDRFGGHSVARGVTTRSHCGVDIIKALEARLKQLAIPIYTGCLLEQLIIDNHGPLIGLTVREGYRFPDIRSGQSKQIQVKRGIVMATGGYGNDTVFRKLQHPGLDDSVRSTNHRGATAEALQCLLGLGALPVHLSWIQMGPWACPDERGFGKAGRFASYSVFPAGIVVDPHTGRRIVNEWGDRRVRAQAIMDTGHPCLGIVDAQGALLDSDSLQSSLKSGKVRSYATLKDLARDHAMEPAVFLQTVNAYNALMASGEADEFGKRSATPLAGLAQPPFYAMRLWPRVHYTPGGVGIDTQARVLDLRGHPMPGLYAAGEVCGGIHGASRLGGCALTEGLVFGRIAGRQAAAHHPT